MSLHWLGGGDEEGRWEVDDCAGAKDGHDGPVVCEGGVNGGVEGTQPVPLATVGLTDFRDPPAPPALPNTPVHVVPILQTTLTSRRSRHWSLDTQRGTALGTSSLCPDRTARKERNAHLRCHANCDKQGHASVLGMVNQQMSAWI